MKKQTDEAAQRLWDLCRTFIDTHRVSCMEDTCEDRIYEVAPDLVADVAEIVGFYERPGE
jgi:hypothetical protein